MSGNLMIVPDKRAMMGVANRTGSSLLPDNAGWMNRLEIRSESSDRLYVVAQNKANKTWACGCMGWKRHRKCKHLTLMLPQIAAATKAVGA